MPSKFLVIIIESPHRNDIPHGFIEGVALGRMLDLLGIDSFYIPVHNYQDLSDALTIGITNILAQDQFNLNGIQRLPILHISAHGNKQEMGLMDGGTIPWINFKENFSYWNRLLGGNLIINVSTCYGSYAHNMAWTLDDPPFHTLIGSEGSVPVGDLALAFSVFYNVLNQTGNLELAYRKMQFSTVFPFSKHNSGEIQNYYRSFINSFLPPPV